MKATVVDNGGKSWTGELIEVMEPTPAPEPEPTPTKERMPIFPLGAGFYAYANKAADGSAAEMAQWWREACGGTWGRFQTLGYHNNAPRAFQCVAHLGPTKDPDSKIQAYLDYRFADPLNFGIILWEEKGWSDDAQRWAEYCLQHKPDWLTCTGPFSWDYYDNYGEGRFSRVEAVISYEQLTRRTRRASHYWYHRALANMANLPLIWSHNCLESDDPPVFAPADKYNAALEECADADALLVWGVKDLWYASRGELPYAQRLDQVEGICEGLKRVWELQKDMPRRDRVPVNFVSGTWREHKVLCSIVAKAGYEPQAMLAGNGVGFDSGYFLVEDTSDVHPDVIRQLPADFADVKGRFYDWDRWTPEVQARLEEIEKEAAEALKDYCVHFEKEAG